MKKTNTIDDYNLTNREKSQLSNKSKFWCNCCDAQLIGTIGKCPVCGHINSSGNEIKI